MKLFSAASAALSPSYELRAETYPLTGLNHLFSSFSLVGYRVMSFAVAPEVAPLLTASGPIVKVAEIGPPCGHDSSVEIYHCPIRSGISSDYAMRIVTGHTAVAVVVAMRPDVAYE